MARLQDLATGRKDLLTFDPRILQEKPGWNRRHDTEALAEHIRGLADSIRVCGVQNPLTIRMEGEGVFVIDGHCRLKATLLAIAEGAEIASVPCLVAPKGATEAELKADQLSRNSGLRYGALEVADVASELLGWGWTIDAIAKRAGKTIPWMEELLGLRAAPEPLKRQVQDGKVSATLAADLVARQGGQKAIEILDEARGRTGKERITKKDLLKPPPPILSVTPTSLLRAIVAAEDLGDDEGLNRTIGEARFYLERMAK
jgi:ParB-like chromosome segregation protein Spo0J